jgi:hypothetical protein
MLRRGLVPIASLAWSLGVMVLVLRALPVNRPAPLEALSQPSPTFHASCAPTGPGSIPVPGAHLRSGQYDLMLVATSGPLAGAATAGTLLLHPTSPADRSPATGHTPVRYDPRQTPLLGQAFLDFSQVAAPVGLGDTLIPPPESADPVRPGVLVLMANWESGSRRSQPVLVIGALVNRRDEEGWMDGPGVALWVRRIDEQGFSGTWGAWGIVGGGQGTFCAFLR